MQAFILQTTTDIKRSMLRSGTFLFFSLAMPVGFFLLFTQVFNMGVPEEALPQFYQDTMMQMTTYSVMISSLFSFSMMLIEDRTQGIQRLIRLTPLKEWQYYASKMATQLLINVLLVIAVFLTGFVVTGVTLSPGKWLLAGVWILFSCLPVIAIGTLISLVQSTNTASAISNLILMPLAIVSGLWWPIDMFPEFVQKIATIFLTYYGAAYAKGIANGQLPELKGTVIVVAYTIGIMVVSSYLHHRKEAVNA